MGLDYQRRLANARDLRLDMTTDPPSLVPVMNSAQRMADDGQTIQTLKGMGWPATTGTPMQPMVPYGSVGVPDDAVSFVQAYLDAGTGDEAISTKMPLLIWLVFMDHTGSKKVLDSMSRTLSGAGAMQAMFADAWCRQILLDKMPELSPAREADEGPNTSVVLLPRGEGIDASVFVCACLHGRIMNREISAITFASGYGTLDELLRRWKDGNPAGGWDQLVRDTLFQITSNWGKRVQDGGTVNRNFAKKLFSAMGGLGP